MIGCLIVKDPVHWPLAPYTNKPVGKQTLAKHMRDNNTIEVPPSKRVDLSAGGAVRKYGRRGAGWGCVLRYKRKVRVIDGSAVSKSEFRMELLGIVNGLKQLKYPCAVKLHTATEYLLHAAGQLLRPRTSYLFVGAVHDGTAKNADLWREFQELSKQHWITTCWVPARSRHEDICRARNAAWIGSSGISTGAEKRGAE